MKVILTRDVKDLGRAHETVTVADGHGLNFLIPRKFAIAATVSATAEAAARLKLRAARKDLDMKLLAKNLETLAEARIVIKAKANEKGHLYDAVGESEIAAAAKEATKVEIPEEAIKLEKPIKEVGTFDIPVSAGETFGKFQVIIEAE